MKNRVSTYRRFRLAAAMAAALCLPPAPEAAGAPASEAQDQAQDGLAASGQAAAPQAESAAPPATSGDDTAEASSGSDPGTSAEKKEEARAHYVTGNKLLRSASFQEAVGAYQRALEHWKHPRIFYNLGVALINLDRPVDAFDAMSAAIGSAEPLGDTLAEQAINYQKLLRRQIGEIEVVCDEPGTQVTMNGTELFRGPGSYRGRVRVGRYQIVASKPDFLPAERSVAILSDKKVAARIEMRKRKDAVVTRRPIERAWVPWMVVGLGGAALVAGGAMHYQAYAMFDDADTRFEEACAEGCRDDEPKARSSVGRMGTARWLQRGAFGSYAAGGVMVMTGLVLAYLNQPRMTHVERSDIQTRMNVAPMVSTDGVGIQGAWSF